MKYNVMELFEISSTVRTVWTCCPRFNLFGMHRHDSENIGMNIVNGGRCLLVHYYGWNLAQSKN